MSVASFCERALQASLSKRRLERGRGNGEKEGEEEDKGGEERGGGKEEGAADALRAADKVPGHHEPGQNLHSAGKRWAKVIDDTLFTKHAASSSVTIAMSCPGRPDRSSASLAGPPSAPPAVSVTASRQGGLGV